MNLTSKRVRSFAVLGVALLALVIAVLMSRGGGDSKPATASVASTDRSASTMVPARGPAATTAPATTRAPGVPDRAYATLAEIDAGRWPDSANAPGTKGGDTWMNREGRLAAKDSAGKPITYQEWDVNPKQRNRSRDAERIVTGSDGSAWYTGDHYETFTRMR